MDRPEKEEDQDFVFDSLGLCFSGGGYRATAFSLGVLSYLDKVKLENGSLLDRVKALSTVSGGTIAGAGFVQSIINHKKFEDYYTSTYGFLKDDLLMDEAIELLMDDKEWENQSKRRNLINSFALAYEKLLVQGTIVDLDSLEGNLKYVCFNATEFSFGLAFRFQNTGYFGNYFLKGPELNDFKSRIRISDAIASSSCFPMGFEPLVFPDDYSSDHSDPIYLKLKQRPHFSDGIGIMDGGIVDNQGIGSMVNILQSTKEKDPINLIIVNDVGSYKMPSWEPESQKPEQKESQSLADALNKILSFFRFRNIYWITLLLGIITLIVAYTGIFGRDQEPVWYGIGGGLSGIGLVLVIMGWVSVYGSRYIEKIITKFLRSRIPPKLFEDLSCFKKLDTSTLREMITERVSSAMLMVDEIFLRQIRRLNYDLLYSRSDLKDKIITTTVYQLNGEPHSIRNKNQQEGFLEEDSDAIRQAALIASNTPTTLWWDEKDRKLNRLDNLIACGQFTTCHNLIQFIKNLPDEKKTTTVNDILDQLRKDWDNFKKDPLHKV